MTTDQELMAKLWEARGCEVFASQSPDVSEYICIASSDALADFIAAVPGLRTSHDRLLAACKWLLTAMDGNLGIWVAMRDEPGAKACITALRTAVAEEASVETTKETI
jgi:hypothetical protein